MSARGGDTSPEASHTQISASSLTGAACFLQRGIDDVVSQRVKSVLSTKCQRYPWRTNELIEDEGVELIRKPSICQQ